MSLLKNGEQIIRSSYLALSSLIGAIRVSPIDSLIDFLFDDVTLDDSSPLLSVYSYFYKSELVAKIEETYDSVCKKKEIRWRRISI